MQRRAATSKSAADDRLHNPFSPVSGKCVYWRERLDEEERWDWRTKPGDMRVRCTCFIDGYVWDATGDTVAADCPRRDHCRYYIKMY